MEINKRLNIDDDIEFLDSGSIVQASNVVTNNTTEGILNENSIEHYFTLPDANAHVVGYIACSDEFIVFTDISKIYRCKESTDVGVEINTNWKWQGGKVIGAYTYNINKELIISITEIDAPEDVPLKIINLDKPEFVLGETDAKYTLNPEIPQFNLINYNIVNGQLMYRGVYNFFIRFKKGDEYSAWYSIGSPIILHDQSYDVTTERYVYNKKIDTNKYKFGFYTLKDIVNNNVEKVNKNINLGIYLYDKTNSYDAYQIGYIVNTVASEIKIYNTSDYPLGTRNVTINGKDSAGDFSLDDITSTFFNIYNVKTLCNYNNRLYIANYKEENPNKVIKDIDISNIIVKTAPITDNVITRSSSQNILSDASNVVNTANVVIQNDLIVGGHYVVKLRYKLKFSNTESIEVTKLFYSRTIRSYNNGKLGLLLRGNTIFNSAFFNAPKEYAGRGANALSIGKLNDTFVVKFENNSTFGDDFDTLPTTSNFGTISDYITYNSSDFVVEEITKIDMTDTTIQQWWFCAPHITFNEHDQYPTVAPDLFINTTNEFNATTVRADTYLGVHYAEIATGSQAINGYRISYDGYPSDLFIYFTNFFIEKYLEAKYPNSSRKYKYKYRLAPSLPALTDETVLDLDNYSQTSKELVRLYYNTVTRKFGLCATGTNFDPGTQIDNYNLFGELNDEVIITTSDGSTVTFNVSELNDKFVVTIPNENKTAVDFQNQFAKTYQWTDDREATSQDFDPNIKYVVNYYVNNWINVGEGVDGKNVKHTLLDLIPKAVGFNNRIETNNTITVDKDFAILIPYKEHINAHSGIPCTGNETYTLEYQQSPSIDYVTTDRGILNNLYFAFIKTNTKYINNINNYTACLLKIVDPNNLKNAVKILDYDPDPTKRFTISINGDDWYDNYDDFIRFRAPVELVYDSSIGNETSDYHADVKKYAINNAVYNFFIHYVYPNGTYTDGIQLVNKETYNETLSLGTAIHNGQTINLSYVANEDTTIREVKRKYDEYLSTYGSIDLTNAHQIVTVFEDLTNVRVCNVFPKFNDNGIALYKNLNGDKLFRGSLNGNGVNRQYNHGFKFLFDNIPFYNKFSGYFISYEKTEPILGGEGIISTYGSDLGVIDDIAENNRFVIRYPEFDLVKNISGNILYLEKDAMFEGKIEPIFKDAYTNIDKNSFERFDTKFMSSIKALNVYAPNDITNNNNNSGILAITTRNNLKINNKILDLIYNNSTIIDRKLTYGLLLNITDDVYLKKDKELISLGYIKYINTDNVAISNYGYESYNYNYDYYNVDNNIYCFNNSGVVYDDINPSAKSHDGSFYSPEFPSTNNIMSDFGCPIVSVTINTYSMYPTFAKNIKSKPVSKYFNFKSSPDDGSYMATELVTHLFPTMANDLFELKPNFYDYAHKLIANYDEEDYNNFIEYYDKTVRRSDVISNESVENKWKKFRPEEYKIIAENKGAIINVIGVGGYLIVHCEHSMFIFNRDSSMQTENKDVQLVIPDAFNIDYVEMFTSNKGYAGIQKINQFVCSNYGYIFYDSNAHKIYRFDEKNLDEITPGLKNLFKHDIVDINFAIDEFNERMICLGAVNIRGKQKQFSISYSFNNKYWISTHSYWYNDCFNTKNKTYFVNDNNIDHFNINQYGDYTKLIEEGFNVFKTELTDDGKPCSYIDVTFNNNNVDRVLDYISYIINKNNNEYYPGLRLLIYTNCCYSGYIDISIPKKTMNDYKHPYYRFGQWVMNWFRNIIAKITTNAPIIRSTGQLNDGIEFLTNKNLNDALIVGRYFVVRLVFHSTEKVSVNNIQCY